MHTERQAKSLSFTHTHTHTYIYTPLIYTHTRTHTHAHTHTYIYTPHIHTHAHTHVHIHTHIHTHIHIYTHINIQTQTHTHMHTSRTNSSKKWVLREDLMDERVLGDLTSWGSVFKTDMQHKKISDQMSACVQRKDGDWKSQTDEKLQTWLCTEKRWRMEVSDRWETKNMPVYREKMENGSIRQVRN